MQTAFIAAAYLVSKSPYYADCVFQLFQLQLLVYHWESHEQKATLAT